MYFPVLIALAIALYVVLIFGLRATRRMRQRVERMEPTGFTVGELIQLKNQGMISDEEFEKARASVLKRGGKEMTLMNVLADQYGGKQKGFDVIPTAKKKEGPGEPKM